MNQPKIEDRLRPRAPAEREQPGERHELERPHGPEELADAVDVLVQVVPVQVDVAVRRRAQRRRAAASAPIAARLPPLPPVDENAGSSPSPRCFQSASRKRPGTSAARNAAVCSQRRATSRQSTAAPKKSAFDGFSADREAADQPGEDRVAPVARVERADDQVRGDEQEDHRREVRERRSARATAAA